MNHSPKPLAIDGGTPTFPKGPPGWPADAIDSAQLQGTFEQLVQSGSWAAYHGPHTERLVDHVSRLIEQPHVRLCSSGTIAVELALRGFGVGEGDEVLLGGYDFPGNFRAIESTGARPVITDIDNKTGCLSIDHLEAAFATSQSESRIKSVIVSHLHGGLAPMKSIMKWATEREITVLEDTCQSPGAIVDGQPAGSWGDASVLSFGGSKLLTAGRGGAVGCQKPEVAQRMTVWADRGNDAFPLSQLQAAVLPSQFDRLAAHNATRQRNALKIHERLAQEEGLHPIWTQAAPDLLPAGYKFGIWLCADRFDNVQFARWIAAVQAEGIALDRGFRGFVRRSQRRCRTVGPMPNATRASERGVVLHHPILLESEQTISRLCDAIECITTAVID